MRVSEGLAWRTVALPLTLALLVCALCSCVLGQTVVDPAFSLVRVWENLVNPTAVRFARDGRVFVVGKGGVIYTAASAAERTLLVAADLSTVVFNNFDKGLVGLAPHPNFPATPHVYVLYSRDGVINGPVPAYNDLCPSGVCFTSGALARLTWNADLNRLDNLQNVLVDWCSGSTTHTLGDLRFDNNNNLLMSSGDNTFFSNTLNFGEAPNQCPLGESGGPDTSGVMLAQSSRSLSGKVVYIPLATLDAWAPGQPSPTPLEVARGLRNPYRFAVDPVTNRAYLGDVGFGEWEEINYLPAAGSASLNFGWPCLEGSLVTPSVQERQFAQCSGIYLGTRPAQAAVYQYNHFAQIGSSITRAAGQSAITAMAVYRNATSAFPAAWRNALFFADYTRSAVWGFQSSSPTEFDFSTPRQMVSGMDQIVDVTPGPDGALYISQIWSGVVWRLNAAVAERPVVRVTASPQGGAVPLSVTFSSTGTFDPLGAALTYAWDLDGSGTFAGPATATATRQYTVGGPVTVSLRVTTPAGVTSTGTIQVFPGSVIDAGNTPIAFNVSDGSPKVGDLVQVTSVVTANGAPLPAANHEWEVLISHCYLPPACRPTEENCHQHLLNRYSGVASFAFNYPDHEYPSSLTFNLQARHPTTGLVTTYTRRLMPATVNAQIATNPAGLDVILNLNPYRMPYTMVTLSNGDLSLDVQSVQMQNRQAYRFASWSQGGDARQVIKPAAGTVYTANFTPFAIGSYPAGQGPSEPIGISVAPGFKVCQVSWRPPATTPAPVTSYIIYYREVKFGTAIPPFSTGLVPDTSNVYQMTVEIGSQCEFAISAVTALGESSFRSAPASAFSLPSPPIGSNACIDTSCQFRSLLIDDWNHVTAPRNYLGLLQESEVGMMVPFGVVGNKLNFRPTQGAASYWYSLLSATGRCLDTSPYTHLTFKITATAGDDFSVGMDALDATCTTFIPKVTVRVSQYTAERRLTGAEQTVEIPLAVLSGNPKNVQSVYFNGFSATPGLFVMDDLALVNRCTTTSTLTTSTTSTATTTSTLPPSSTTSPLPSGTCAPVIVDAFSAPGEVSALGLWAGGEGGAFTKAAGALTIRSTAAGTYYAWLLSPTTTCASLANSATLQFGLTVPSGGALPTVTLQQKTGTCAARDPSANFAVALTPGMVTGGVATIPLTMFTGANLALPHAIALTGFTLNADYVLRNVQFACSATTSTPPPTSTSTPPSTSTTTTPAPTGTGTCTALTVDSFAAAGDINLLGLWAGGEGGSFTKAGGALTVRSTAAGTYYASELAADGTCRSLSAYSSVRFGVTGTAPTTIALQLKGAGCAARDRAATFRTPLASYITAGVATVPLSAFAGADLTRAHGIVFEGFALNVAATFTNLQFVCGDGTPPPPPPPPPPPTTCVRTSIDFATPAAGATLTGTVNLLGRWAGGNPLAALTSIAGPPRSLRVVAPSTAPIYFASVLTPATGCFDATQFTAVELYVSGPAGGSFRLELQSVPATVASCSTAPAASIERRTATVNTSGAVRERIRVPLAPYVSAGMLLTKVHAYALVGFTTGTFTFDSVSFTSSAC